MVISFSACGNDEIPYNAVLYDNVKEGIKTEFLRDNLTYGAYNEYGDEPLMDMHSPETRSFIIKEQDELNKIFIEFLPNIDFEREMVLMYGITSATSLPYKIEKIELKDELLKIEFKIVAPKRVPSDGPKPYTRWFVIKIDKLNITTVQFTCLKRN